MYDRFKVNEIQISNTIDRDIKIFKLYCSNIMKPSVFSNSKILIGGIAFLVAFGVLGWLLMLRANTDPNKVSLSTVSANSFTVTTFTDWKASAELVVADNPEFKNPITFNDERDYYENASKGKKTPRHSHVLVARNLEPNSEYYYKVKTTLNTRYEEETYIVRTPAVDKSVQSPQPVYGEILNQDGKPQKNIIVEVYAQKASGVRSSTISTYTSENGTYSLDLSNLRTHDYQEPWKDEEGTPSEYFVTALSTNEQFQITVEDKNELNPAPTFSFREITSDYARNNNLPVLAKLAPGAQAESYGCAAGVNDGADCGYDCDGNNDWDPQTIGKCDAGVCKKDGRPTASCGSGDQPKERHPSPPKEQNNPSPPSSGSTQSLSCSEEFDGNVARCCTKFSGGSGDCGAEVTNQGLPTNLKQLNPGARWEHCKHEAANFIAQCSQENPKQGYGEGCQQAPHNPDEWFQCIEGAKSGEDNARVCFDGQTFGNTYKVGEYLCGGGTPEPKPADKPTVRVEKSWCKVENNECVITVKYFENNGGPIQTKKRVPGNQCSQDSSNSDNIFCSNIKHDPVTKPCDTYREQGFDVFDEKEHPIEFVELCRDDNLPGNLGWACSKEKGHYRDENGLLHCGRDPNKHMHQEFEGVLKTEEGYTKCSNTLRQGEVNGRIYCVKFFNQNREALRYHACSNTIGVFQLKVEDQSYHIMKNIPCAAEDICVDAREYKNWLFDKEVKDGEIGVCLPRNGSELSKEEKSIDHVCKRRDQVYAEQVQLLQRFPEYENKPELISCIAGNTARSEARKAYARILGRNPTNQELTETCGSDTQLIYEENCGSGNGNRRQPYGGILDTTQYQSCKPPLTKLEYKNKIFCVTHAVHGYRDLKENSICNVTDIYIIKLDGVKVEAGYDNSCASNLICKHRQANTSEAIYGEYGECVIPDVGVDIPVSGQSTGSINNYFDFDTSVKAEEHVVTVSSRQKIPEGSYSTLDGQTISIHSPSKVNFYEDKNGNGVRDSGEEIITSRQFTLVKQAEAFSYNLVNGWNAVNFPFYKNAESFYSASDIIAESRNQGAEIISIKKWAGKWVEYSVEGSSVYGKDFSIQPNEGYFVRTIRAGKLNIFGTTSTEPFPQQLLNGWSLVGVAPGYGENNLTAYTHTEFGDGIKAFEYIRIVNKEDPSIQMSNVTRFDSGVYRGVNYTTGQDGKAKQFGLDFTIDEMQAYFVKTEKKTVFTP
ncbi:MAG: hypothetical protein ACOCXT_04810 [Candidatus Dojkabacteria bacterium]